MPVGSSPPAKIFPVCVAVLAYDGVDDLDLIGAYSVLSKAADIAGAGVGPLLNVRILAARPTVRTSGGLTVHVQGPLTEVTDATAVVVPGGRGAAGAAGDPNLLVPLRRGFDEGAAIYGICSGSILIAAAGITAPGDHLAVHHSKRELLRRYTSAAVGAGLVRSGTVCTVGGDRTPSVKSVDIAFAVLSDCAPHLLDEVSERLELVPGRTACAGVRQEVGLR